MRIYIDTAWLISILLMLCAGVLIGIISTTLLYNRRDNAIWAEIGNLKQDISKSHPRPVTAVITDHRPVRPMMSPAAETAVLGDTRYDHNNNYHSSEAGLNLLDSQYKNARFPGTKPMPAVRDTDVRPAPYDGDPQTATVAVDRSHSELDIWGGGRSVTDVLREIEEKSWTMTPSG